MHIVSTYTQIKNRKTIEIEIKTGGVFGETGNDPETGETQLFRVIGVF